MSYMLPTDTEVKLERNPKVKKTRSLELDLGDLGLEMPQPSVSGMDPPFGDAFQCHTFSEQTLTSTDLLANSSDPDFMYELDREMDYQQSSRDNFLSMEDCKDIENLESFTDILDNEAAFTSNWEQWDTYCEDLTKYTKLTSCDIWGTKEVDYLGLDDFSSPYQDEEVISKTPTLAQLNNSLGEQPTKGDPEEDEEDEEDIEDEDHDEGFGSEHELSENDDEEEDYEEDKDDDISDTFSEPGYENDSVEDLKESAAVSCRKRGKRRYFWEYSEQLTPSQQERMLRPSEWSRDTLPSNMYQKNGLHHGKYAVKKSRRTDVEDLTPNPKKLLQIGNELRKLNKVISDLTPVSELPLTARPRSRKEKNKLASRACRLKKKAQYEANKVKLWGLNTEYDNLLFVINSIKQEIVNRVQSPKDDRGTNMEQKLDVLIKDTLGLPVAGQTSEFVNQVLEKTAEGDPTGGLVGLRIPTSKV
uniref:CREB3 regulatory factor n=1 Tax=Chrysemys picta bellii TaxID=8478 RepID=A0A8C3FPD6_CHRPI